MMLGTTLRLPALMAVATVVAPAAAPVSVIFAFALREGSPSTAIFAPLTLVTIPGMYGYVAGFLPVLLLGTALTIATLRYPDLRPKRIWIGTGASSGFLIGLAFRDFGWDSLALGVIAGSACALTYRLIVGPALPRCRRPS